MLRVSPPACSISISPSLRLTTHGKLLSPFHQENRVFGRQLVKADGFQLALVLNAIEIDVVELNVVFLAITRRCPSYS